ncbi:MAG: hypothetical protein ACOYN0_17145, partial [Phycisphaerales bacterium]
MKPTQKSDLHATARALAARLAAAAGLVVACVANAAPVDSTFTYRGELSSGGVPAAGAHDIRFRLYDSLAGGAQVGPTLCMDNAVLVNGRFTVALDFGMVFDGTQHFLEVEVRPDTGLDCSDATGMTTLEPRQTLLATPNAAFAINAANAVQAANATTAGSATTASTADNAVLFNGQSATFYQDAANLTGTVPATGLAGAYSEALTFSNAANVYSGNGAALTALNATNLSTGTLSDLRLSSNVARRNAANIFGNFTNSFGGNVGIGTTSPNASLEVGGSIVLRETGDNPALRLSPSTGGFGVDPEFFIQDTANTSGSDTNFHLSRNAFYQRSDTSYNRVDVSEGATSLQFLNDESVVFAYSPAAANPVVWQSN